VSDLADEQSDLIAARIHDGKDREVQVLLADQWRKLVLIQLRRSTLLADHSAASRLTFTPSPARGCSASAASSKIFFRAPSFLSTRT